MMGHAVAASLLALAVACRGDAEPPQASAATPSKPANIEQALANIIATCAQATGVVEVRRHGQPQWEPIAVGATLRERDWVRAGAGGFARIRFSKGGFLELREGTTILVDTALGIESGSIVAVAEPGSAPLLVKVEDGSEARIVPGGANARIRLTAIAATEQRDHGIEIAVTEGDANVVTDEGDHPIAAGEARDLSGRKVGSVVKLIPFPRSISPGVDARFQYVPEMSVALRWREVKGAARYHVQVARDTEFSQLVLDTDATETTAAYAPTGVGELAWRVAAIDAEGRVGEFGFVRRLYLEAERPRDLLVGPPAGIKFGFAERVPRIAFSWQSAGDAATYKLVIRSAADPNKVVASVTTPKQRVEVGTLGEGTYVWTVYAVRDGRDLPIFLTPRALIVRKQRVKAHTEKLWNSSAH